MKKMMTKKTRKMLMKKTRMMVTKKKRKTMKVMISQRMRNLQFL